jgi:hypothetical protein
LPVSILFVLLLFFVTFFGFLYLYAFFNGFFGGYDKNTIAEFEKSAYMVTGVGFFARMLYKSARLGTKISPLHNRFPVGIYGEAYQEATELDNIKKKLII